MVDIVRYGSSRTVILMRRWAIKLPGAWTHSGFRWRSFLRGLLHNMQEHEFAGLGWHELCPVVWAAPGGLMLIMPRAQPLCRQTWLAFEYHRFFSARGCEPLAENKIDSFGIVDGRIVAIDYGG